MKGTLLRSGLPLILLLSLAACGDDPSGPSLDDLRLEAGSPVIVIGDTTKVAATGTGAGGDVSNAKVKWRSLDPGVATVNGSGVVTGVARGSARITGEAGGARDTIQVSVIPARYNVRTDDGCANPDYRTARVMAVSKHAIVIADTANPAGGFTKAEYESIARSYDEVVYPVVAEYFGVPADIDGNGKVIIFYTRAVNEMTPPGSSGYIGGFFFARDLFPKTSTQRLLGCAGSNEAEMFYLMVADPNGVVNGNRRSKDLVQRTTLGTIAHEFQHLSNASRRIFVNDASDFENVWLNEGLSHIAEELVFYDVSGLAPRQNLGTTRLRSSQSVVDAFSTFQISNIVRLHEYFQAPTRHAAYSDTAKLGDRGAGWNYLRYIADRLEVNEREFWFALSNAKDFGFANLARVTGLNRSTLLDYYRDWAITAFTDDLVATTDATYQQPSWDSRSILPVIGLEPIVPRRLAPGVTQELTLYGGGSAYLTFRVAAGERAEIRLTSGDNAAPAPGACTAETPSVELEPGEVFAPEAGEVETLCVENGAASGEYAVVLTNPGPDVASSQRFALTGFGIETSGPVTTVAAPGGPVHTRAPAGLGLDAGLVLDRSLDIQLRMQEQLELTPLLGGARGFRTAALFQAVPEGPSEPYLSLVRLK